MECRLKTVILECEDTEKLVDFYAKLLDWPVVFREDGFVRIESPESGMGIAVQYAEDYARPVWPSENGKQQMMVHLDFGVNENEFTKMIDRAVSLGAEIAEKQYGEGEWVTMIDPAGHPFCILIWNE